jgi:hypothetical protein
MAGFLVDEWTEVIPSPEVTTGLSFHYDRPDARPPQAVLLAVPPDPELPWTMDSILQIVREALGLTRSRAVDIGELPRLGRVLPALHAKEFSRVGDMIRELLRPGP